MLWKKDFNIFYYASTTVYQQYNSDILSTLSWSLDLYSAANKWEEKPINCAFIPGLLLQTGWKMRLNFIILADIRSRATATHIFTNTFFHVKNVINVWRKHNRIMNGEISICWN